MRRPAVASAQKDAMTEPEAESGIPPAGSAEAGQAPADASAPASVLGPEDKTPAQIEDEVDEAILICGGDIRAALRATLVANAYLDAELERVLEMVSVGYVRGQLRADNHVRPAEEARTDAADQAPESEAQPRSTRRRARTR